MAPTLRALGMLVLLAGSATTQAPPGYVVVDDMVLPADVVFGDGAFVPNHWPLGLVPYAFDGNVSATNRARTLDAMGEIEAVTGVDFFPRAAQPDYVVVTDSTVNQSFVGVMGGAQAVQITSWNEKFVIVT